MTRPDIPVGQKTDARVSRPLAPSDTRGVGLPRNAQLHPDSGCASRQTSHSASSSGSRATSDQPHSSQRDRFSRSIRQNAHGISGVTRPGKATSTRTCGRPTRLGEVFRSTPWRCPCPSTPTGDGQPSVYLFVSLPALVSRTVRSAWACRAQRPTTGSGERREHTLDSSRLLFKLHCENSDRQRRRECVQSSGHLDG